MSWYSQCILCESVTQPSGLGKVFSPRDGKISHSSRQIHTYLFMPHPYSTLQETWATIQRQSSNIQSTFQHSLLYSESSNYQSAEWVFISAKLRSASLSLWLPVPDHRGNHALFCVCSWKPPSQTFNKGALKPKKSVKLAKQFLALVAILRTYYKYLQSQQSNPHYRSIMTIKK